jgi:hypothetical protein
MSHSKADVLPYNNYRGIEHVIVEEPEQISSRITIVPMFDYAKQLAQ